MIVLTQLSGKIRLLPLVPILEIYSSISMPHRHASTIWQGTDRSEKKQPHIGGSSLMEICLNPDEPSSRGFVDLCYATEGV
ncbi:hypothetical protein F4X33_20300 [Candidatus Poribacteria bacterium]|nr:hypothetical protein [Candidatus Poribacteria bacterium]